MFQRTMEMPDVKTLRVSVSYPPNKAQHCLALKEAKPLAARVSRTSHKWMALSAAAVAMMAGSNGDHATPRTLRLCASVVWAERVNGEVHHKHWARLQGSARVEQVPHLNDLA